MPKTVIAMKDITKKYFVGTPNELTVLKNISLQVNEGEFVSVVGASGSGKSTLMNIIGALDHPSSGRYLLDNSNVETLDGNALSDIRNQKIGFVFQTFNLVPRASAQKNVEVPLLYSGTKRDKREKRSRELLQMVDMDERRKHMPSELSGGQKQRVAIARAMATDPDILLADEPTGALDTETGRMVMDLFHKLNKEYGKTIILITHNPELAKETDRIITIGDGKIVGETNSNEAGGNAYASA